MRVTIGMPVYNAAATIGRAVESLLAQTYCDFELVISDNASTDATRAICEGFAASDTRIRYVRQPENRGADVNFGFVLDEAAGEYFMWAAADDTWGPAYVERNVDFLDAHPDHVGAMGAATYVDGGVDREAGVRGIEADSPLDRIQQFLRRPGFNSRFYSLFRTRAIRDALVPGNYLARDWAIMVSLLGAGKLHVLDGPPMLFRGTKGLSSSTVRLVRQYRSRVIEHVVPLFQFSAHVVAVTGFRPDVLDRLLRLNVRALRNYHRALLRERLDRLRQ